MSHYFTFKKCFEEKENITKFFNPIKDFLNSDGFNYREVPIESAGFHIPVTKRLYVCDNEEELNFLLAAYGNMIQRIVDDDNFIYKLSYINSIRE